MAKPTTEYRLAINVINAELAWCRKNQGKYVSKEFSKGFIKGLLQARRLIQVTHKLHKAQDK